MKKQLTLFVVSFLSCFSLTYAQHFSVAAGGRHSVFLCDSALLACGWNQYGQLGDGSFSDRMSPVTVSGLSNVIAVAAGHFHSLFLKNDGTVWACGFNFYGALGNGTTVDSETPIEIQGLTDVVAIAAGYHHSLFLKADGSVWSCGANYYGQLGVGTTIDSYVPIQINTLAGVIAISTFSSHNLFLKNDGAVMACGANNGALGDGTAFQRDSPVSVTGLTGIIDISAGAGHSLFLKNDGTVWGCGGNTVGQLGDGTNIQRYSPVEVSGLANMVTVDAGRGHSLFLGSDGTVWSCGENSDGQLGNGDITGANINLPVQIEGLTDVQSIAASWWYSFILKNDGTVWGFGRNFNGQLGDGTQTGLNEYSPILSLYECDKETGIREEASELGIALYPNPASQSIRVEATGNSTPLIVITITNMLGHAVLSLSFVEVGGAINISNLANGIYTLTATLQNGETLRQRLVVQH